MGNRLRRLLKSNKCLAGKAAGEQTPRGTPEMLLLGTPPKVLCLAASLWLQERAKEEIRVMFQIKIFMIMTIELSICKVQRTTTWKSIHRMSTTTTVRKLNTKTTTIKTRSSDQVPNQTWPSNQEQENLDKAQVASMVASKARLRSLFQVPLITSMEPIQEPRN